MSQTPFSLLINNKTALRNNPQRRFHKAETKARFSGYMFFTPFSFHAAAVQAPRDPLLNRSARTVPTDYPARLFLCFVRKG